jgi:hypothetical protein
VSTGGGDSGAGQLGHATSSAEEQAAAVTLAAVLLKLQPLSSRLPHLKSKPPGLLSCCRTLWWLSTHQSSSLAVCTIIGTQDSRGQSCLCSGSAESEGGRGPQSCAQHRLSSLLAAGRLVLGCPWWCAGA